MAPNRLPRRHLDLRDPNDPTKLSAWAHFQVLAAMLAPEDKTLQRRFLAHTGLGRPGHNPLSQEELGDFLNRSKNRGRQVGFMIGILCQLFHVHGIQAPTVEMAIDVLRNELPRNSWDRYSPWRSPDHMPRSGRLIRKLFHEFGTVGHLWAAVVHREQQIRHDAWTDGVLPAPDAALPPELARAEAEAFPISLDHLPEFLALADEICRMYGDIPTLGSYTRALRVSPVRIKVPGGAVIHPLKALPLPADRLYRIKGLRQNSE